MASTCPSCGSLAEPGARFCARCGTSLAPRCPDCGAEVAADDRFCSSCGHRLEAAEADATPPRPAHGEERRVVSVLFVDLVGFTARTERSDPEDVKARLNTYHAAVRADVERLGGRVEKLMGDGVFAVFGTPTSHEDDPERAVRAALRVCESVERLNTDDPDLSLAIRAAVTTGEAIVQLEPVPDREGVIGDVVNTASRLEGVAAPGTVIVDERTYLGARTAVEFDGLDPVSLKGKAAPVPIWRALRPLARFGVAVEEQDAAPFVGRAEELRLLEDAFGRAAARSTPQLVTLVGEPGVGKSRLMREFRRRVDDRPEFVWWRQGRCVPYGEGVTFWAIGELVKAHAGILEGEPPAEVRAKLRRAVDGLVGDDDDAEWITLRLAVLAGGATPDAETPREELFAAWTRFFEALAARHPLVLVVEDLHWADDAVVEFLDHLLDWCRDSPILTIVTARPELHSLRRDWGSGRRDAVTLSLVPLSSSETAELVSALTGRALMAAEAQQTLLERSGGNPLYVTEFVRLADEQGFLDRPSDGGDLPLPDSIQAIIQARIDLLDAARRALLQAAAVVGKVFWSGAVAFLTGVGTEEVDRTFRELARRDLVRGVRRSSMAGQSEWTFGHVLVRDVAYRRMTRDERGRLHEATASWLEAVSGDRAVDVAELLAHHHAAALELRPTDDPARRRKVYRFLMLAGDRARGFDSTRGRDFYVRALDLAGDDHERGRTHLELSRLVFESVEDAVGHAEEAAAAFAAAGDPEGEAEAEVQRSNLAWARGLGDASAEHADRALEKIEGLPPSEVVAAVLASAATKAQLRGEEEEALDLVDRALDVARTVGDTRTFATALVTRGTIFPQLGDWTTIDDIREGLRIHLDRNDTIPASRAYANLATMTWLVGDLEGSIRLADEAIEYDRQRGLVVHGDWMAMTKCEALFPAGRWDDVVEITDRLIDADDARGGTQIGDFARMWRANVRYYRGAVSESWAFWRGFVERCEEIGDVQGLFPALCWGIDKAWTAGDERGVRTLVGDLVEIGPRHPVFLGTSLPDAARAMTESGFDDELERLLAVARGGVEWMDVRLAGARGILLADRGDPGAGVAHLSPVWELGDRTGHRVHAALARLDGARCLFAEGRPEEAEVLLDGAARFASSVDAGLIRRRIAEIRDAGSADAVEA